MTILRDKLWRAMISDLGWPTVTVSPQCKAVYRLGVMECHETMSRFVMECHDEVVTMQVDTTYDGRCV